MCVPGQVNRGDLVGHLDLAHLDTGQAEAIQIAEKKAWLKASVPASSSHERRGHTRI